MMNELGADARALIDQARSDEPAPGPAELDRIRRNVVAGAASSAVMLAAPPAAGLSGGVAPLSLLGLALKGGAAGTVVVLAAFTADRYLVSPVRPSDPAVVHDARSSLLPVPPASPFHPEPGAAAVPPGALAPQSAARTTLSSEPARREATNREDSATVATGAAAGTLAAADLQEETALLRSVQQELRAGRGARALELLDTSSLRLERGQLRQERLAAEVLAACLVGDLERARRSARAFAAENPATPSLARLRSSCVGSEFFAK
jgi:hypothetical protein